MYICLNRVTAGGGLALPQFVDLAATAGFHGADVDFAYAQSNGLAALRDLYLARHMQFGGWGLPFDWKDPEKEPDGIARLSAFARFAAELKVDSCATWITSSSDKPFMENWKFHSDRLKPCAAALKDAGLRLGLEFLGPYHIRTPGRHEFIFTPGQMLELAADIGENVGLLVDIFHVFTSGTTYDMLSKIDGKKIVLVHLNDAPDLPIPKQQDSQRAVPGEGVLDVGGFLDALEKTGYSGPVSVEVFSPELKKMPPLEAAKRTWKGVQKAAPHYASRQDQP